MSNEKLCECGCGSPIPLAAYTNRTIGWVRGEPRAKFIHGHGGRRDPAARLADKLVRDSETGCLNFVGSTCTGGYGQLRSFGVVERAHRLAWELAHGPIPDGLFVCHKCDNPPCCNVQHLFLGTNLENMQDMSRKGRNTRAKLTGAQVVEIRERLGLKESTRGLARCFGVSQTSIARIKRNRIWRHIQAEAT